jgi:hypothetical protein
MDHRKGKFGFAPEPHAEPASAERRRIGKIVHDERGNAIVEWEDAPADYDRPPLSIEDNVGQGGARKRGEGYDPYERTVRKREPTNIEPSNRRNLRALSEWIKKMRELEERRKRGDDDSDD